MAILYQKKLLGISKTSRFAHVGTKSSGLEFKLILMQYQLLKIPDASWQRFKTSGLSHLVNNRCTSLKKNGIKKEAREVALNETLSFSNIIVIFRI